MKHEDDLDWLEKASMLSGKQLALSDWSFRKEEREFKKLCARLYSRNWARRARERDPARVRERQNRWRLANRDHVRAVERRYKARKRKAFVNTCKNCGGQFRPKRYRKAIWCSRKCSNHFHGVARAKARNRGLRNMELTSTLVSVLGETPWLTLPEIAARVPGSKYGSIASKLSAACKTGEIAHDGGKMGRRYALPGAAPCGTPKKRTWSPERRARFESRSA